MIKGSKGVEVFEFAERLAKAVRNGPSGPKCLWKCLEFGSLSLCHLTLDI